jgi:hypothetical protein
MPLVSRVSGDASETRLARGKWRNGASPGDAQAAEETPKNENPTLNQNVAWILPMPRGARRRAHG